MVGLVLVCSALLAAGPDEPTTPSATEIKAYHDAKSQAGRDPDKQVQLALWCEAHGLHAERLVHLARAVLADPSHAAARGLMGLVPYQGRWERPEAVADRVEADAKLTATLAEYNAKRAKAKPNDADDQWALAVWCEQHDLKAEASAHFTAVTRLDPKREAAWKRMGYTKHNGRWMTDEQVAEQKAEAQAQKDADKYWEPLLTKWKGWLDKEETRAEAEAALAGVTDPRAVGSVWNVFALGDAPQQKWAVQLFGQIDHPASSRALTQFILGAKSEEVRRIATETLRRRDPREYVPSLFAMLRKPIHYKIGMAVNQAGIPLRSVVVEGEDHYSQFLSGSILQGSLATPRLFANSIPFDPLGRQYLPGQAAGSFNAWPDDPEQAFRGLIASLPRGPAVAAARQRDRDIGMMQYRYLSEIANPSPLFHTPRFNSLTNAVVTSAKQIEATNATVLQSLVNLTDRDFGQDFDAWQNWWLDSVGYRSQSSPQPSRQPRFKPTVSVMVISCFAEGTPVHTRTGLRPIEKIRIGDLVLTRNTANGALSYQPVLVVHHNPPGETLRIELEGESIVSSVFHRFWRAGKGWAMARDLSPGDVIRTLNGTARIIAITDDKVQPVFNLDVAENRTFFVGQGGALVHDNSLPSPRDQRFDASPTLVSRHED